MHVLTMPEVTWAKFMVHCRPVNTKLFSAWLQENQEYDIAANMYIVWYTPDEDEVS